jgi:hypothetical protein
MLGSRMPNLIRCNSMYQERPPENLPTDPSERIYGFERATISTEPGGQVDGNSCGSIYHNTEMHGYGKSLGTLGMSETKPSANDPGSQDVSFRLPKSEGPIGPDVIFEHTEEPSVVSRNSCNSDAPKVPQYGLSPCGSYEIPQTEIPGINSNDSFEARNNDYTPSNNPPKQTFSDRRVEAIKRSSGSNTQKSLFSGIKRSPVVNEPKPKSRFQPQLVANVPKPKSRFQTIPVVDQDPPGETSFDEFSNHEISRCDAPGTYDSGPQQKFDEFNF